MKLILSIGTVLCIMCQAVFAVDGFSVYANWYWPINPDNPWSSDKFPRGPIIRADIQNNAVVSRDTLYDGLAEYPAINLAGTKVAFYVWGQKVELRSNGMYYPLGPANPDSCFLCVVNRDGTGFQRLIQVDLDEANQSGSGEGNNVLDWPSGDWIYYERPSKTGEIWRINVNDPSLNELVVGYVANTTFRRWSLSLDAKWAGSQVLAGDGCDFGNDVYSFPPPEGTLASTSAAQAWFGCNMAISASGQYFSTYQWTNHSQCYVYLWNQAPGQGTHTSGTSVEVNVNTFEDLETWTGGPVTLGCPGGADVMRWAANSDKWVSRQVAWWDQGLRIISGTNQILVNWVDRTAINASQTTPPPVCDWPYAFPGEMKQSRCASAGDFWVDGGAGNESKYEDADGNWITVLPIDPGPTQSLMHERNQRTHHMPGFGAAAKHVVTDMRGRVVGSTLRGAPGTGVYVVTVPGAHRYRMLLGE